MNEMLKVIAMMFLIREKSARERKDYGAAVAYANAYDMLCYAVRERSDCLCQFDGYDEAIYCLDDLPRNINISDLEDDYNKMTKGE